MSRPFRRRIWLYSIWLAGIGMAAGAASAAGGDTASGVSLATDRMIIDIASRGGLPVRWESCARYCEDGDGSRQLLAGEGDGTIAWAGPDLAVERAMASLQYQARVTHTPESVVAVLTATEEMQGRRLVQRYELSRTTHSLRMRLQLPPGLGIRMAGGPAMVPPPLPGFGAVFSEVDVVRVTGDGQDALETDAADPARVTVQPGEWFGMRRHFWAWLVRAESPAAVRAVAAVPNQPDLAWQFDSGTVNLEFYAGPVEWKSLRAVSGDLTRMLFPALWDPLRWLCYGLLFLLGFIMRWVTSPGVAIIVLSLVVKIILWPLTRMADGWQQAVNRTQSRIQPRIDGIRRSYKGEEAHNRILQVYREEGVHPLFTMKSMAGFAIQVPMFIAAFDMLADNFALQGASFLWISNLAAPDRLMPLPFTLPFFGGDLNALPLIMTLVTVISALTQRDDSLTPALLKKQRLQLYLMAAAFFLLFYTFPAGMVLYWTANNVWHLLKVQAGALLTLRS